MPVSPKPLAAFLGAFLVTTLASAQPSAAPAAFGPQNPFYAPSTLPYQAPPFDRIKDTDYQPAIDAGMAEQRREIALIAGNAAAPTFDNTLVAMERSGSLFTRVMQVFSAVSGANTNPTLQAVQDAEAPRLAALQDAIYLDPKLFARVDTLYKQRTTLKLDPESRRLLEVTWQRFVHAGANLSEADKTRLKQLNEEESTLQNTFITKLLAASKEGAFHTEDATQLAGLSPAQMTSAAEAAKARKQTGYLVPLQNTTQQPDLAELTSRATRQALFEQSWNRAERGGAAAGKEGDAGKEGAAGKEGNDTRETVLRLAALRAEKARLLGFPTYAAWNLSDQMAKTPQAALKFMDALVPGATAKANREAADIQAVIDAQKGGFTLQPADWEFYAEQVRKARYDLDESRIKPYFELDNVLHNGVFFAATQLYGITFKERHDLPVYQPDVRVFEVFDASGKTLALFYCDYFKRDNKNGGAWMNEFVGQSTLLGTIPVIYNVANLPKPAPGAPALITFEDVTTMFHEFGHGLHGIFADTIYPSLSGPQVSRDFVEFPSQFNEHWASDPIVFAHYAKHYQTGAPMPAALAAKIKQAATFNQGYRLTELLAAAQLDLQWHTIAPGDKVTDTDAFEQAALTRTHLNLAAVPPRYRTTYFAHIWGGGYAAGYYAYLWAESLDDNAFQWFDDHGGLTRANGERFRAMILSKGNTVDLDTLYHAWLGHDPAAAPMLKYRGLVEPGQ